MDVPGRTASRGSRVTVRRFDSPPTQTVTSWIWMQMTEAERVLHVWRLSQNSGCYATASSMNPDCIARCAFIGADLQVVYQIGVSLLPDRHRHPAHHADLRRGMAGPACREADSHPDAAEVEATGTRAIFSSPVDTWRTALNLHAIQALSPSAQAVSGAAKPAEHGADPAVSASVTRRS